MGQAMDIMDMSEGATSILLMSAMAMKTVVITQREYDLFVTLQFSVLLKPT